MADKRNIEERLKFIYKESYTPSLARQLVAMIGEHRGNDQAEKSKWSQEDVILITYGDSIQTLQEMPLNTLGKFLKKNLKDEFSIIHLLPFFPYTSDDGFSVVDYLKVNPALGDWRSVETFRQNFDLMFDLVINHISAQSSWFQNYLAGENPGMGYFIEEDPETDLSAVVRPRSLPLLTPFQTSRGKRFVWTTFSEDQVDLNFRNPEVMLEMMAILLQYMKKGARIIRLDAIAFLWKQTGTPCIHLPETHEMVKLMRDVAEMADPSVVILTETNVPNQENRSYFGSGDEAHMIYQFSLPPLLLHALYSGKVDFLNSWASSLEPPPSGCTYFNFTASHDGIGVRPLEGLLPEAEKHELYSVVEKLGGYISTRRRSDGSDVPYELNITYFHALKESKDGADGHQVERFLASQTIMMALQGIPAFYIHSLTATPNYTEGVKETGRARTINRRKWDLDELNELLENDKVHKYVFNELKRRMRIRKSLPVFHPDNEQFVIPGLKGIFALVRVDRNNKEYLVSVTNMLNSPNHLHPVADLRIDKPVRDVLTGSTFGLDQYLRLRPYQTLWLHSEI